MPKLLSYCDVILADVDSAKLYFNINPDENNLVESTCILLKEKLPNVKYIAMTMRSQKSASSNGYSGYLWHNSEVFTSVEYSIDSIAECIGTGDAFMAGLIYGLHQNQLLQQVIEYATACGLIKHGIVGDMNVVSKEEVEMIIKQKASGRIIR